MQQDDEVQPLALQVDCVWHEGPVEISQAYQNGKRWKCKECYGTERWLQKTYAQRNEKHIWTSMSFGERQKMIEKHRGEHGCPGVIKREFHASDSSFSNFRNEKSLLRNTSYVYCSRDLPS